MHTEPDQVNPCLIGLGLCNFRQAATEGPMKSLHRWVLGLFSILGAASTASAAATAATTNEGIWADDWLGGYGTWLPLLLAVTVYLIVWVARKQKK